MPIVAAAFALASAHAQILQSMSYKEELQHAQSLIAGTATDAVLPHHVHYDLKLYDNEGHESTATYDVYRDFPLYERIEIKAPNFQFTRINNLRDHKEWQRYTGDHPLRMTDFEQAFDQPRSAIKRFAEEPEAVSEMQPQQLEGAPLLCANDDDGTAICFNPMIHLFAFAQMFNRTIMYDQWLPIGTHTVPGSIRIFQDKKLLVQATGTVEEVKHFPPHFMEIPDTPSQPDPGTEHKILHYKPVDLSQMRYGNLKVRASVNEQGKVTKAEIDESDDKHLDGIGRKFVRNLVFAPEMKDGVAVPFETVVSLEYYPKP